MAEGDELWTLQVLERKIAVARKELNNLRRDVNSLKRMFILKFKEVKEMVEKENQDLTAKDIFQKDTHEMGLQRKDAEKHDTRNSGMKPIGFVESCFKEKNGIPRQPSVCPLAKATLPVNVEGFTNPVHSLEGLEKFSHVWIIFNFHQNTNKAVKAKVKPPRLDGAKVGVFASRSPHRPNPIGLTLAKLDGIIGNRLLLSGIDLLDGTPVLDIKPYVPDYDIPQTSDCKEIQDPESSDSAMGRDVVSKPNQETAGERSLSSSVDEQPVDQSEITRIPAENSGVTVDAVHARIAEWIRKPPINELNVNFCAEALAQIRRFHGSLSLREPRVSDSLKPGDRNVNAVPFKRCTCGETGFDGEKLGEEATCNRKACDLKESSVDKFRNVCQTVDTDRGNSEKSPQLPMSSTVSVDAKPSDSEGELKASDGLKQTGSASLSEELQSYGTCIYQLKMFSSPEEAKTAIADILKADPRSVYRRNHCQDKLYRFSIDTMNVKCKFEGSTVEVLQVESVYYRKMNKSS